MKKIILLMLFILLGLPMFAGATGGLVSVDYYNISGSTYIYPLTFDNLVFSFAITPETGDVLKALSMRNLGSARDNYEINKLTLWEDTGLEGFQGFAVDKVLKDAEYLDDLWVFNNLNIAISSAGKHFFISVETKKNGTGGRSFNFSIPQYFDANKNANFDSGDMGIFLESGLGFPISTQTNTQSFSYKAYLIDIHNPVSVITNLKQGQILNQNSFLIKGASKDQGFSAMNIEICIDAVCTAVTQKDTNYLAWEYNWTNIADGVHTVYVKSWDASGNTAQTESLTISMETTPVAPPVVTPPVVEPPVVTPPAAIDYTVGNWVKLANQKAVYFLDLNNVRHAYPTQKVWESYWGPTFSKVITISVDEMAGYTLGRNVPFKAGTLMKIPSVPKVYYIDANATLRWVQTEAVAKSRFGDNWAQKVVDLPESFFTDYTGGAVIDATTVLN